MWGITRYCVRDGRIVEEWTLFNGFGVMRQIYHE
jgi:hypothetical protein